MIKPSKLPSKSAQIPSFRASLGHLPWEGLGVGFGFGFGFGFGLGLGQVPHPLTRAKKRRLTERKRASEAVLLEAMIKP